MHKVPSSDLHEVPSSDLYTTKGAHKGLYQGTRDHWGMTPWGVGEGEVGSKGELGKTSDVLSRTTRGRPCRPESDRHECVRERRKIASGVQTHENIAERQ